MTAVKPKEFTVPHVYIGSHEVKEKINDQGRYPSCTFYAVGDLILYHSGRYVSCHLAYLDMNRGKDYSEGRKIKEVMDHAMTNGFLAEEAQKVESIPPEGKGPIQLPNASKLNTNHMLKAYGLKDCVPLFKFTKENKFALSKEEKILTLQDCFLKNEVPIVIAVNGINFDTLEPAVGMVHAVAIYGYNEYGFLFKNSYGEINDQNYTDGMATLVYKYTDNILEAYYATSFKVFECDESNGIWTERSYFGFSPIREHVQHGTKITEEVTRSNVQDLIKALEYVRTSIKDITLNINVDESVKETLIEEFSNEVKWPGMQYASAPQKKVFYARKEMKKAKK